MQAIHFAFALGAFFSPLIIHSFLDNNETLQYDGRAIRNSFWIMAAVFVPVALFLCFFKSPSRQKEEEEVDDDEANGEGTPRKEREAEGSYGSSPNGGATLGEEYEAFRKETPLEPEEAKIVFYGLTGRELTIVLLTFTMLVRINPSPYLYVYSIILFCEFLPYVNHVSFSLPFPFPLFLFLFHFLSFLFNRVSMWDLK